MSSIPLMRTALQPLYRDARDAHPGLLLQRGYREHESGNAENLTKTEHIHRVCKIPASDFHRHAYQRWLNRTIDQDRFQLVIMTLESRLFIGLSGSGMLETGCAIHHSYGTPYIPGSSIKGAVNAFARHRVGMEPKICDQLFGAAAEPGPDYPDGLSGLITFYDAWWVPDSAPKPLVEEIVTSHHLDYYGKEGEVPASDCDSPIPNHQIAVQGSFLFTLEGPTQLLTLATDILQKTLIQQGVGAKTRSGYGFFREDDRQQQKLDEQQEAVRQKLREQQAQREAAAQRLAEEERIAKLSVEERELEQLQSELAGYTSKDDLEKKESRSAFIGKVNAFQKSASRWAEESLRNQAADLLKAIWEGIGWYDPDKKKANQREKQEQKRRNEVAQLRQPPAAER